MNNSHCNRVVLIFIGFSWSLIFASASYADYTIEFLLAKAEPSANDQRTIEDLRAQSLNSWCEFVEFDGSRLLAWIRQIGTDALSIDDSSISLRLDDNRMSTFDGTAIESSLAGSDNGPNVWEGRLIEDRKRLAVFIVEEGNRTRAYVATADGMHVLIPSMHSDDYFHCKRDPNSRRKVD